MDIKILQSYYKAFDSFLKGAYKGDNNEQLREFIKRYLLEDYFMNTETYERSKPTSETIKELITKVKAKITYDYFKGDLEGEKNIDEIMAVILSNDDTSKKEIHIRSIEEDKPTKKKDLVESEIVEPLEEVKAIKPENYTLAMDKVTNKIFKSIYELKENEKVSYNFDVSKKNSKEKIYVLCITDYKDVAEFKKLDIFDLCVLDAIVTLYEVNNSYATLSQIYRVMCGNDKAKLSLRKATERDIRDSINKMRNIDVEIDNTDEVKHFKGITSMRKRRHLLEAEVTTIKLDGNVVSAIKFMNMPINLEYAKIRGHIDRNVPIKMLDTPVNKTKNNFMVQSYLLRRIKEIDRGSKGYEISIDKLLKETGIIETSEKMTVSQRKKKQSVIETCKALLNDWKEKGLIEGYTIKGKRPVKSIVILKE